MEPYDQTIRAQTVAHARVEDSRCGGRDNGWAFVVETLEQYIGFALVQRVGAALARDRSRRAAVSVEQPVVVIPEGPTKHGCEQPTDCALAGPHRADDHNGVVRGRHRSACAFAGSVATPSVSGRVVLPIREMVSIALLTSG
jgi:hypothetical protein